VGDRRGKGSGKLEEKREWVSKKKRLSGKNQREAPNLGWIYHGRRLEWARKRKNPQ